MFQSPGEIAFEIFGLPVYFYGIILAVAILIGVYTSYFIYKKYYNVDNNAEKIFEFAPYIIIIGILGARLYYCLVNYSYYLSHPLEILNIRQGGLSIHGMIIIGILSLFLFSKHYKMSFLKLSDVFLCASALGQAIGRWGNFFNSEAYGIPANLPWKLYIPPSHRPIEYFNQDFFHPAFLYESIADLLIFIILILLMNKFSKCPGTIASLYLIMYSFVRIFIENIRIDSALNIHGFPIAQIISLLCIITATVFLIIRKYNK